MDVCVANVLSLFDSACHGATRRFDTCWLRGLDVRGGRISYHLLLDVRISPGRSTPAFSCALRVEWGSVALDVSLGYCSFGYRALTTTMHLFINGLAASAGGGLTYLRNILAQISTRSDVCATVLVNQEVHRQMPVADNVRFVGAPKDRGTTLRVLFEQVRLRAEVMRSGAELLLSTGNVALHHSPVPQILLSRNALYVSSEFRRDLRTRGEYTLLLDTWVKAQFVKRSVRWADFTIAPSEAFARELSNWTGRPVLALHHGFDRELFLNARGSLTETSKRSLEQVQGALRLLCVSHYNYYRNLETLFRALAVLKRLSTEKKFVLVLTCRLDGSKDGSYSTAAAAEMINRLNISAEVVQLGTVPYDALHELYRACDVYVTAAYAETFAHPLVEAMSAGLSVVASDLDVHREICGEAARYFPYFSDEVLADHLLQLAGSQDLRTQLAANALERSKRFSWQRHVDQLLAVAAHLIEGRSLG